MTPLLLIVVVTAQAAAGWAAYSHVQTRPRVERLTVTGWVVEGHATCVGARVVGQRWDGERTVGVCRGTEGMEGVECHNDNGGNVEFGVMTLGQIDANMMVVWDDLAKQEKLRPRTESMFSSFLEIKELPYGSDTPHAQLFTIFAQMTERVRSTLATGVYSKQVVSGVVDNVQRMMPPIIIQIFMEGVAPPVMDFLSEQLAPLFLSELLPSPGIMKNPINVLNPTMDVLEDTPSVNFLETGRGFTDHLENRLVTDLTNHVLSSNKMAMVEILVASVPPVLLSEVVPAAATALQRKSIPLIIKQTVGSVFESILSDMVSTVPQESRRHLKKALIPQLTHSITNNVVLSLALDSRYALVCQTCAKTRQPNACSSCIHSANQHRQLASVIHQTCHQMAQHYLQMTPADLASHTT